jgi:protein O-mannosyl-transferase
MLVTLPLALVLLDYWPIRRFETATGLKWLWKATIEKVPLLVMTIALSVVTYMAQVRTGTLPGTSMLPMGLRVSNALESYVKYIAMVFYPAKLAVLYPLELNGFEPMAVAGCFVLLLLITIVVIAWRRKRGFLFTGWFWYLGTLVPVIGLVQVGVQSMADRYMYLPGIGIYIIIVWLINEVAAKLRLPKAVPAVTGVVILVVLLLITRIQVGYWKDSESLSRHALDVTSNNAMMHYSCGDALMVSGRLDEAIEQFRKTVSMRPAFVDVREKLASVLQAKGRNAEAVPEFEMVLKVRPDDIKTRNNYGVALIETGLYDKAIEQFSQVLAADPYHSNALNNLYKAGVEGGKTDKVLDVILSLQAKALNNFKLYEKAGLIYGTKGNINAAITQLETACRMTDYREMESLDFLSQAYAAQKDMAKAVETAQKALEAAKGQDNQQFTEQISKRLELYKQNSQQGK